MKGGMKMTRTEYNRIAMLIRLPAGALTLADAQELEHLLQKYLKAVQRRIGKVSQAYMSGLYAREET